MVNHNISDSHYLKLPYGRPPFSDGPIRFNGKTWCYHATREGDRESEGRSEKEVREESVKKAFAMKLQSDIWGCGSILFFWRFVYVHIYEICVLWTLWTMKNSRNLLDPEHSMGYQPQLSPISDITTLETNPYIAHTWVNVHLTLPPTTCCYLQSTRVARAQSNPEWAI